LIPHSRPRFGRPFSEAVLRILDSGHVAMGREAKALEDEAGKRLYLPCAVAVDSGTSALMLAVRSLKSDRNSFTVGIPAYTCSAVLHAVRAAGAVPLCMDCADDLRLDRGHAFATAAKCDAVVLVHPFGLVEPLVSEAWPCPVIEDIAQSAGGSLNGKPLGSFGDIAVASFYATKPWGGIGGGMVLSRDAGICAGVHSMRCADGASANLAYAGNHQLSDVYAAMARTRLAVAGKEKEQRAVVANTFDAWLADRVVRLLHHHPDGNYYRYIIRLKGCAHKLIKALQRKGVAACRPVEMPISHMLGVNDCPGAEKAWQDCVSLPLLGDFSQQEMRNMQGALSTCIS